jgi:hypothetical protein
MTYWLGNSFNKVKLNISPSKWLLQETLSCRAMIDFLPFQETAVYSCQQVEPPTGKKAIVKVHQQ